MSKKKLIKKVWIMPGCLSCGACQFIAPKVFRIDGISKINENVDLEENSNLIGIAAKKCPASVIKFEEE